MMIRQAADCCLAVYQGQDQPKWATSHLRLTDLPLRVAVYNGGARRYIVAEGTSEIRHWVNNLSFWRRDVAGLSIQDGFADIIDQIRPLFRDFTGFRPVLAGHSLGGVVMSGVAAALKIPCDVVTFGAPKSGAGPELGSRINGRLIRIQNGSDAVPRLPWWRRFDGGHHIYITVDGDMEWDSTMMTRLWDRTWRLAQHGRLTDHRMIDYRQEVHDADLKNCPIFRSL